MAKAKELCKLKASKIEKDIDKIIKLVANPRYRMIPVDKAAEDAERKVIREALDRRADEQPASFDVP